MCVCCSPVAHHVVHMTRAWRSSSMRGCLHARAAGEYIAVERVENVYKACSLVEQIWVYGNSFESCLVRAFEMGEVDVRRM